MHAGEQRVARTGDQRFAVAVGVELFDREGVYVHFVEPLFHGSVVDLVGGVGQVAGVARVTTGHGGVGNGADVSFPVDGVGADEQLFALAVDHAVGRGATDAAVKGDLSEIGGNGVELVGRTVGQVGPVGDHPKLVAPRDDGSGATFTLLVVHGQTGVDSGDRSGLRTAARGGAASCGKQGKQSQCGTDAGFTKVHVR